MTTNAATRSPSPVDAYDTLPRKILSLGRIVATVGRVFLRFFDWICDGSEFGIIEAEDALRILAEHKQARSLALASDIDRIHEEMSA